MKNILIKLYNIQQELKAPKGQFNNFGKYKYRSCEDILESLKGLLGKERCILTISDTVESIDNRYYIVATVRLTDVDTAEEIITTARAREEENKKGMDGSQVTGSSSSYARKYALNGLFAIDDTKDSDVTNQHTETSVQTNDRQISQKQLDFIIKLINQKKYTEEQKQKILEKYSVKMLKELTSFQAKELIDILNK